MMPEAFRAEPVLVAIRRGWLNRASDEGLTGTELANAFANAGLEPPADLAHRLRTLEAAGLVVCEPSTSQPVWRLRTYPQPLLDELDDRSHAHMVLERSFDKAVRNGDAADRIATQRSRMLIALSELQDLEVCLDQGLPGRRRYLQDRARYEPASAADLAQLESDVSRIDELVRRLEAAYDQRLESRPAGEGAQVSAERDRTIQDARERVAWGRADLAVAYLETAVARVSDTSTQET